MTCKSELLNNNSCINCKLKYLINIDSWGSNYLTESTAISNGKKITTLPKNVWTSIPKRKVVICDRGVGINVEENS